MSWQELVMDKVSFCLVFSLCIAVSQDVQARDRTISVYVALADNEHQGIVPVPKAIGNGDDPENNLYWGTADGLKGFFDKSKTWKLVDKTESPGQADVLRTRTYRHTGTNAILSARAYKGSAIKQCVSDFENAVRTNAADLVVYIGHNGLMDFKLPEPKGAGPNTGTTDCIVLCCKSEKFFTARLNALGGKPVLLTTQFMYPGAFILDAAAGEWLKGANTAAIRRSAGAAYAKNQKISIKAGLGVFSDLDLVRKPAGP